MRISESVTKPVDVRTQESEEEIKRWGRLKRNLTIFIIHYFIIVRTNTLIINKLVLSSVTILKCRTEVGIYKRKQESKKREKMRSRPDIEQENDQEKRKFYD